jgi:hypothetical protein
MTDEHTSGGGRMRCERRLCSPAIVLVACFIASTLLSCSDSGGPCGCWCDRGLQIVPVDRIAFPDTVCSSDTLTIAFWSNILEDKAEFSHFDLEIHAARLEITAWAWVSEWVCDGTMPPVEQVVLDGDPFHVSPPLPSGSVEIAVRQPDDTFLVDTVMVEPCPELVYSCSFESETDVADWSVRGELGLTDDAPPGGGSSSIWVRGTDHMPHARYVMPPAEQDGYYVFCCWAKRELPVTSPECGGLVSLRAGGGQGIELCVQAWEWTRYESPDTLFCPAGEELQIELNGVGSIAGPSTKSYVDLLEVWRLNR